jgi:hypothetical protein
MVRDLDKQISLFAESTARRLTRRRAVTKGVKATFGLVTGLASGAGLAVKRAEASCGSVCTCSWAQGRRCTQSSCPVGGGCPTNYNACTNSDWCDGWCIYPWPAQWCACDGLGGGLGYKVCTDCKANIRGCGYLCTCLSGCINCSAAPSA